MTTKEVAVQSGSVTLEHLQRMAVSFAKSNLFGIKDADQALSLLLIAQAEGRSPALAVRDYHIIQGRPSLKADTLLSRFQAAGGKVDWKEYTDTKVVGVFSHPAAGTVTIEWTIERAKQAGLAGKDVWKNYPRAMLRSRCVSEGVRTCYPGVAVGIYTPEELESGAAEIDITPVSQDQAVAEVAAARAASATALTPEEIDAHCDTMGDSESLPALQSAYMAAHEHAKLARDNAAKKRFDEHYRMKAESLGKPKFDLGALI
jgi:hypothetical protein